MNESHPSVVLGLHKLSTVIDEVTGRSYHVAYNKMVRDTVLAIAVSAYRAGQGDIIGKMNNIQFDTNTDYIEPVRYKEDE